MSAFHAAADAPAHPRIGGSAWPLIEDVACFGILLLLSGALLAPLFNPGQQEDAATWLRVIWPPVYAAIAILTLARLASMRLVIAGAALCLLPILWAFASSRWSIDPGLSSRRALGLGFTTLFGLYLAATRDWRRLAELCAAAFLVLTVGTCVAAIVFPHFGRSDSVHPSAWSGLWYEKNQCGRMMAYGAVICACAAVFAPERRRLWIGGAVLSIGAVAMSQSTTSFLGLALAFGVIGLVALVRCGGWVRWATAVGAPAAAVGFAGVLAFAPNLFFGLVGKDASLTGRTDIWAAAFRQAAIHPVTGWGYGAFWLDPWGPAWFIRHEVQWTAPTAHDGWLDILLQLGVVGVALAAVQFLVCAVAAAMRLIKGAEEAYWAAPLTAMFALFSISESTVMQYNEITWTLYIATMAKLLEVSSFVTGPIPRASGVKLFPDEDWV